MTNCSPFVNQMNINIVPSEDTRPYLKCQLQKQIKRAVRYKKITYETSKRKVKAKNNKKTRKKSIISKEET